jgi:hypothetical protein
MKMRRAFEKNILPTPANVSSHGFTLADWSLTPSS